MYTPEEVAAYLQVNVATIYRWIRSGKLHATKIGRIYRISPSDIQGLQQSDVTVTS